jgi:hypothetical protein
MSTDELHELVYAPRRLQVRWDRDAGRWFAFVLVACAVMCFNRL